MTTHVSPSAARFELAWIPTGIFSALMAFSGVMYVAHAKFAVEAFHELGYPPYFMTMLGLAKILGVVALIAPRSTLREWAYAGFTFDLAAAAISHAATDGPLKSIPPLVALAGLFASYFLRRRAKTEGIMKTMLGRSVWLSRIVIAIAALLFARIGLGYVIDPLGEATPHGLQLASNEAVTIMRVMGGVFLGLSASLIVCLARTRTLVFGLGLLAIVAGTILVTRLVGLALDGPAPFTMRVLKPEIVITLLAVAGFFVERRRREEAAS